MGNVAALLLMFEMYRGLAEHINHRIFICLGDSIDRREQLNTY